MQQQYQQTHIGLTKLLNGRLKTGKTKSLLITGKRLEKKILGKDSGNLNLNVRFCNNQKIKQISSQKLLGVTLDKGFTYEAHIDNLYVSNYPSD